MLTIKNILPVTTVKRDLMKLLKKVQEEGNPLVITKDGKTAGVLMSGEEYEGLMETLEILGDKQLMRQLKKADEDFRKGHSYTHEQVFKE
ncbi:MAG: type II toxin-antitoxin system Phd/YefM family antitoxin [Deltaproteobacteria bacterium]|nr:type II toxin-antitoxin system Phd/YefM family antitoxin [Deltaproteobacteria bacterium]